MIQMLIKSDGIRQVYVNNKILIIIRTNFIYIKKHQSQEADMVQRYATVTISEKNTCQLSQYIFMAKKLYELYQLYHMKYLSYRLFQVQQETHQLHHYLEVHIHQVMELGHLHNTQTINNRWDIQP